jgi:choline dehydrogenase-like flavoprotein
VTYWPHAIRAGVELQTNCRVREITIGEDGMATGVVYCDPHGVAQFQPAEVVIAACNGVDTPRLLLRCVSGRFPDGLANSSGLVGENLMFHPWANVTGYADERLDAHRGSLLCLWSWEFYETDRARGFVRGLILSVNRSIGVGAEAVMSEANGLVPWGEGHHDSFRGLVGHRMNLGICTEDLPEEYNRVTLDPMLTDGHGIPAPRIDYTIGENTSRMLDFAIECGKDILAAAGARHVHEVRPVLYGGWHLMGTARMGNDCERSVVNAWGRSHDVKNLFIVDGSIFVTAGGVNPTSTIRHWRCISPTA